MNGTRKDLSLIQQLLDTRTIEPESTYTLQALGLAFGRVFIHTSTDAIPPPVDTHRAPTIPTCSSCPGPPSNASVGIT
jgi:hypothetical protein